MLVLRLFAVSLSFVSALKFDIQETEYNLNQNNTTSNPLEYSGEWPHHSYQPSPLNWRFPFYTLFLDRFVNGEPSNDDINGTVFEHDVMSNQFRHGGDVAGLVDTLDYIQGIGIKVSITKFCRETLLANYLKGIYIAGSPFINLPWKADSYSVGLLLKCMTFC